MKTSTSTLNPFAVAYVPVAKGQVQDADKECKTMSAAIVNDPKLNVHQTDDSLCTSAEIPQEIGFNFSDVESEMDLAYLQMTFPGISVQFLNDVYNINGGDLESAIDMLSELESTDGQQDAVNIDNALMPVSSGECSSAKDALVYSSAVSSGVTVSDLAHVSRKAD
ncbi:hypothetical protein RND81_08G080800 [Saponaria officinalis]|uniref:CUE domain-containing protein n=1 Tax=Saponaria officinalis TaxID=3572 RepID=A0AAW1J636_SAPOF